MTINAIPTPIKVTRAIEDLRVSSPRPETPEPDSRQGRRNARAAGVQLLDDDGAISEQVSSTSSGFLLMTFVEEDWY